MITKKLNFSFYFRGDILVFLTGQEEIETLSKLITDCANHIDGSEFDFDSE